MKITVGQLKRIIKETINESKNYMDMEEEDLWRLFYDEGDQGAWNALVAKVMSGNTGSPTHKMKNPLQPTRGGTSYDSRGNFHGADFGRDWS